MPSSLLGSSVTRRAKRVFELGLTLGRLGDVGEQLLLALVDLHDDAVMEKLVFSSALLVSSRLRCQPVASTVDSALPLGHQDPSQPGAGGKRNDARDARAGASSLESIEASSQRFLLFLDALLQGLCACLSVLLSPSFSRARSLSLARSRSLALVRGARARALSLPDCASLSAVSLAVTSLCVCVSL